ncbi:hypothetical protein ACHAWC_004678 [Mediolabrus comicus]
MATIKKLAASNKYVASRNGVVLSWQQIHQQYKRVDDSSTLSINSGRNNSRSSTPLDSNTLLQLLPRGAYTTCRTVKNGTAIYQFDYHVQRLASSASSILENLLSTPHMSTPLDGEDVGDDEVAGEGETDNNNIALATSNHPIQHDRTLTIPEIDLLDITNVKWEKSMAMKCIRDTLHAFCQCYEREDNRGNKDDGDDDGQEFKITLLATWEKKKTPHRPPLTSNNDISQSQYESVLYCHVGLLKPKEANNKKKSTHTRVLVHGHGRENATAKDSKWVFDREKLQPNNNSDNQSDDDERKKEKTEEDSQHPFEEIILLNNNGELLEGTQTNFYVVSNTNSIITANEGILYGSVRDSVLRVCENHTIHVELRPPTLDDLRDACGVMDACGVFISSTSRWVMEVHEVCLGDLLAFQHRSDNDDEQWIEEEEEEGESSIEDGKMKSRSYFYGHCETVESIRRWVLEDVESRSTSIFDFE